MNTLKNIDLKEFSNCGAIFEHPESKKIYLGVGNNSSKCTNGEFELWDFFGENKISYSPRVLYEISKDELKAWLGTGFVHAKRLNNVDKIYQDDFKLFYEKITKGELKKVVLKSRQYYDVRIEVKDILAGFLGSNAGYLYGFWSDDYGIIGLSPETLLSAENKQFSTMALAGTMLKDNRSELLRDEKELNEHNLVVQDIKEKLGDVKNLKLSKTDLVDYKNFSHLKTDIIFQSDKPYTEILTSLLPTAALGGYPTDIALHSLKESYYYKNTEQFYFGGALAFKTESFASSLVTIRNIQWSEGKIWIESGTGIVSQSIFENEIEEIGHKRRVIEELVFKEVSS